MLLTKKSFIKILVVSIFCFALGSICLFFAIASEMLNIDSTTLFFLSILLFLWGVFAIFTGLNAEGKAVHIKLANKLVNNDVTYVSENEIWLLTAEWMQPVGCEKFGSDNSIWIAKVKFE